MVLWGGRYIVPRRDGRVLVGSTVEYCGFRKKLAAEAYDSLLAFAAKLFGDQVRAQVEAHWAGLRPDAGTALPLVGCHPAAPGLWFNTGHFRNGLVLALGSAARLSDQIVGNAAPQPVSLPTAAPLETVEE
jgi:glycine oxidase